MKRLGGSSVWLGALAFAGVWLGHQLAYAAVTLHTHDHAQLMARTGHRYWPLVGALALGAIVTGLAGFLGRTWRDGSSGRGAAFRHTLVTLGIFQIGGFLLIEASERTFVTGGLSGLFGEPAVLMGIVTQVLVAAIGSGLLMLLSRATRAVKRVITGELAPTSQTSFPNRFVSVTSTPPSQTRVAWGLRGPPVAA